MKKIIFVAIMVLSVSLILVACAKATAKDENKKIDVESSSSISSSQENSTATQTSSSNNDTQSTNPKEIPMVADAAMYRGELTEIDQDGKWIVKQVDGRNYGKEQFICDITSTNFATPKEEIKIGDYLQLYYSMPMGAPIEEQIKTIQIQKLLPADMCVINGTITEIKDKTLTVAIDGDINNPVIIHIYDETKIYASELKKDDKISIFYNGALMRSMPPQANAMEISLIK